MLHSLVQKPLRIIDIALVEYCLCFMNIVHIRCFSSRIEFCAVDIFVVWCGLMFTVAAVIIIKLDPFSLLIVAINSVYVALPQKNLCILLVELSGAFIFCVCCLCLMPYNRMGLVRHSFMNTEKYSVFPSMFCIHYCFELLCND